MFILLQSYPAVLLITSLKTLNEGKVLFFPVLFNSENHHTSQTTLMSSIFFTSAGEGGGMKPKKTKNGAGWGGAHRKKPQKNLMQWRSQVAKVVKDSSPKHQLSWCLSSASAVSAELSVTAQREGTALPAAQRCATAPAEMGRDRDFCPLIEPMLLSQDCSALQSQPLKVSARICAMPGRRGPQTPPWNSRCPQESLIQTDKLWEEPS